MRLVPRCALGWLRCQDCAAFAWVQPWWPATGVAGPTTLLIPRPEVVW